MKFGDIKGESKEDQAEARRKKATDDDAHREEKEAERLAAKAERDARKKARKEQRQAEREAERQKKEMAAKVIRSDQEKAKRTKEEEVSTEGEVEKPATRRRHLCEGEDQDCDEEAPVDATVEELPPPCEGEGCEILETTAVVVPEIEDEVVSYNAPSMMLCCCQCTKFPCACQCDGSSQPEPMPLIESQEEETDPEQMVGEGADPIPDEMENEP